MLPTSQTYTEHINTESIIYFKKSQERKIEKALTSVLSSDLQSRTTLVQIFYVQLTVQVTISKPVPHVFAWFVVSCRSEWNFVVVT